MRQVLMRLLMPQRMQFLSHEPGPKHILADSVTLNSKN